MEIQVSKTVKLWATPKTVSIEGQKTPTPISEIPQTELRRMCQVWTDTVMLEAGYKAESFSRAAGFGQDDEAPGKIVYGDPGTDVTEVTRGH